MELTKYIFKIPGVKFFLSERLSQDPIENFFGMQRQRGRTSENPNVYDFCKNTQALRIINSVCGNIPKGNSRGNKQSLIDVKKESKPLPKRRRVRKQCSSKENLLSRHDTSITLDNKTITIPNCEVHTIIPCTSLEDNPLVHEDNCSRDPLEDEDDHAQLLEDEDNPLEGEDNHLEDEHIEAEDDLLEEMLSLIETDELSDAPDLSDEMFNFNLSDEEETIELQSALTPTESATNESPVPKLCKPSVRDSKSESSSCVSKMTLLAHVDPLIGSANSSTNEKPLYHIFSQKIPVRSLQYVYTDDQEKFVNQALGTGASNEVMVRGFSIALQRQDMWTLNNSGWLNDQVSQLLYMIC